MKNPAENNKRVAKNTLFLYFRMILIMLVTLYTSRGVLAELGIDDYGIYNVVGGVVLMFSFLNSCMSTATQRFLTFELGRGDTDKLKNVFAAALNIHIAIGILIIFLAETIGLWFVNEKLVIPDNRIAAANWVYQFSILTFCINIIQVPYNAVLIAHEKMNVYAYISILEALLKLGIVYLLVIVRRRIHLSWISRLIYDKLRTDFTTQEKRHERSGHWHTGPCRCGQDHPLRGDALLRRHN